MNRTAELQKPELLKSRIRKPELLSPAGSLKNMRYAFAYGADAVYAGQPRYSLRVRNNEFDHDNLAIGIHEAHQLEKKFYVVCNIQPHNSKLTTFIRDLEPIIAMAPDALIMSDPGLIMMVKTHFPQMAIHLSVQANAVNWATVQFWAKQGIERVILSRELSIEEIAQIHEHCPEIDLEVFVHGALCMAYSGRCLLSGYMNKRDSNQGTCTNACRWQYNVTDAKEDASGQLIATRPTLGEGPSYHAAVLLEEVNRPGELMPAFEDEHGTYIMNSKDLRAVQHVERLIDIGVHSLKIEGRTKSFYYCARTAQVYRQAIDDAVAGRPFNPQLLHTLDDLANRGYTEGFLRRHVHQEYQNYEYGHSISEQQQFVGEFTGKRLHELEHNLTSEHLLLFSRFAEVKVKNKFLVGDIVELMTPQGNKVLTLTQLLNKKGEEISDAKGDGHLVYLEIDPSVTLEYALLMRHLNKGETTRNPFKCSS